MTRQNFIKISNLAITLRSNLTAAPTDCEAGADVFVRIPSHVLRRESLTGRITRRIRRERGITVSECGMLAT